MIRKQFAKFTGVIAGIVIFAFSFNPSTAISASVPGVTDDSILIGMTYPSTGSAALFAKIGEINEVGLYFNHCLAMNSLGEPFESFKVTMKTVNQIVAKNIKENPKPVLVHKLNELKVLIENCSDKEKLHEYLTTINNMI